MQSTGLSELPINLVAEALSNAWDLPEVGNNCPKGWLIPHVVGDSVAAQSRKALPAGLRPIS